MAFAITHKLSNGSATDAATYTTASVSVTAGDILWVVVTNASTVGVADALFGIVGTLGSTLTWNTVGSVLMNSSSRARTTIAWAVCPSTTSGTLTFQYGGVTQASGQWTIVTTTGSDTTTPVANFQTLQTAGANPSITLSPAPAATSMVLAAMHANDTTSGTAGTGYALIGSGTTQSTPAITHSTEQATATPPTTVAFVKSGATNKAMIAVEIQGPQSVTLAPVDSAHENTSDSPGLTQVHALAPADTADEHTAESPALTQVHQLAPADSFHGNTATSPSLSGAAGLTPADTANANAAGSPALTQVHMLAPADSFHANSSDAAVLTQVHQLVPLDTLNTHSSSSSSVAGTQPTPAERTSVAVSAGRSSTPPVSSRTSVAAAPARSSAASGPSRTSTSTTESRTSD